MTTPNGTFTAKLQHGKRVYNFTGRFNSKGQCTKTITGKGLPALSLNLQLNLYGAFQIIGQVAGDGWSAELLADRCPFGSARPSKHAGKYTVLIPAGDAGGPDGDSVGTVTVSGSGVVQWNGTLADGTKVAPEERAVQRRRLAALLFVV